MLMKLNKIFNVEICKNPISMEFAYENPWNIPYVTTTSFNNWVETFVDYTAQYEWWKITVSKDWWSADAFLQEYPFCWNEKVMVLSPKVEMTKKELLFYCYLINKNKYKFAYWRKCSVERINELDLIEIKDFPNRVNKVNIIPITTKNKSWKYELNVDSRKEFRIWDIFTQDRWKESAPNQNLDWETPIVNETDNNNWVTRNVEPTKVFKWNAITISINVWYNVFYQPYDFCASVNIAILKSKYLNKYNWLFIVSLIKHNNKRYSYWYKTSKDKINDMIIKLPVDKNWEIDREFMENYIKNLPYWDRI